MNALEIKGLSKKFQTFHLDNLNFTLPTGCIMGLIGENGAGKSTTIRLILDMIRKDSGTVTILGRDNQDALCLTKQDIGVVMDNVGLPDALNAKQIGKIMHYTFKNWDDRSFENLVSHFSIPMDKVFKDFSRGMKMKLGLAIALSHDAKLLILDEATSGLDPVARDQVVELLYEFTRDENHSVLMSSHIVSDLEKLCDYIAFVHQGRLLMCQEKDVLLSTYGMLHCTPQQLEELDPRAVIHKRGSVYGVDAVVLRKAVPMGMDISPIGIEELFVAMVKGGQ